MAEQEISKVDYNERINESLKIVTQVGTTQYSERLTINQWYVTLAIAEIAGIAKLLSTLHDKLIVFVFFGLALLLLFIAISILIYCIIDIQDSKRAIQNVLAQIAQGFLHADLSRMTNKQLPEFEELQKILWDIIEEDRIDNYSKWALILFVVATVLGGSGLITMYLIG